LQLFDSTGVYNSRIAVASDGLLFRNFYANSTNDAIAYSFRNSNDGKLVTIKGGGNVGIGTTAPSYKLDVVGNVNAYNLLINGTAVSTTLGTLTGTGTAWYIPMWNGTTSLNNSGIYQNGGNIGIGTTAAAQKLEVIGNINVTGDIYPSTGYTRNLGLSGNRWGAFYTYNADISNLLTVGGNTNIGSGKFFVNATSGRVGIGTTSPGQIMAINGVYNSITPVIEYQVDGSIKGYMGIAASTSGIINGAVSGDIVIRSQGQKILFSGDSGSSVQMMINGTSVGIGTATPVAKLEVDGGSTNMEILKITESVTGSLVLNNSLLFLRASAMNSSGYYIKAYDGNNGAYPFVVRGDGKVGIGTASPISQLSVGGPGIADTGIYGNGTEYGIYGISSQVGVYGNGTYGVQATGWRGVDATGSSVGVYAVGVDDGVYSYGSTIGVYAEGGQFGLSAYGTSSFDVYAPNNGVGPFTGGHEAKLSNGLSTKFKSGMIVSVTGESQKKIENGTVAISSTLPTVKLSEIVNDKKILGVFVKTISLSKDHWYVNLSKPEDKFGIINALGDGRVLVTDINGNIEAGDYITTSNIAGYGMKQNDDLVHSYTLGKATEDVEWETVKDTVTYNGKKYKVYLIGVVYTSG